MSMKVIVEKADDNSIELMYEKVKDMAKEVELIIVVGEKKNSNINQIYDISLKECGNVMHVEKIEDLYINYAKRFKTVGIIQDNILPEETTKQIINILEHTQVEGYIYEHYK